MTLRNVQHLFQYKQATGHVSIAELSSRLGWSADRALLALVRAGGFYFHASLLIQLFADAVCEGWRVLGG